MTLSSAEADCLAMIKGGQEALALRAILLKMGIETLLHPKLWVVLREPAHSAVVCRFAS